MNTGTATPPTILVTGFPDASTLTTHRPISSAARVSAARWKVWERRTAPRGPQNSKASGAWPRTRSVSSSTRKDGKGTSRRSWPLVAPQVITPLIGETDSATTTRRRARSTRMTRSAATSPHRRPV